MSQVKIGVLLHTPLREELFREADRRRLDALGEVAWCESADPLDDSSAVEILRDAEIAIGSWGTPGPTESVVGACPKLKLWIHAAGSVKKHFRDHVKQRGLMIASCAPAIAENVAEFTLGELIVGLKRVLENDDANRKGPADAPANARPLGNCTIGLAGASQVGRRVIRNLRPFGARVLLFDPHVTPEQGEQLGVEVVDEFTELCRCSDAVSLHVPSSPATRHMLGARQLAVMKDDCVIVNTARGTCIDEEALTAELAKGRFFAFLDVSDPEPAADDSPLRSLPNVVYTSHIAGGKDVKIGAQAVDDVERYLRGEPLLMAPTWDQLEQLA